MPTQKAKEATAAQVKEYFGFATVKEFKAEWDALEHADKTFFKQEVGQALNA